MIEQLKKKLGIADDAKTNKVELTDIAILQSATASALDDLQASVALLTAEKATVATLTAQLAEASMKLEAANTALAAVELAKQASAELAKVKQMAARKAVVVDTIGTAKADAFLSATESLDDAAFEAVHMALVGSTVKEAGSALFKESGVDVTADASKVGEITPEMKALTAKYTAPKAQ